MKIRFFLIPVFVGVCVLSLTDFAFAKEKSPLKESLGQFSIRCEAPVPREIEDPVKAQKLAEEAAISWGQNQIYARILDKEARSGKTLAVAQMASSALQEGLKEYVKQAKVRNLVCTEKKCQLVLVLDKKNLKKFLKKN